MAPITTSTEVDRSSHAPNLDEVGEDSGARVAELSEHADDVGRELVAIDSGP
jgi:hypothetical protein